MSTGENLTKNEENRGVHKNQIFIKPEEHEMRRFLNGKKVYDESLLL